MSTIDLQLRAESGSASLQGLVVASTVQELFSTALPADLERRYRAWRRRYLAHHDPAAPAVPAETVQSYSNQLLAAMRSWLALESWSPLRAALAAQPGAGLRLRLLGTPRFLDHLPWELLFPQRLLWRLAAASSPASADGAPDAVAASATRQPRLLVLVGQEHGLDLSAELTHLQQLQRRGGLDQRLLRGPGCSAEAIAAAIAEPGGWDGLVFLGHSQADPGGGGRLLLGNGTWFSAGLLTADLASAARGGLRLALLTGCEGIDVATTCVSAGISWAVCFREPVPSAVATNAFTAILGELCRGTSLGSALLHTRHRLERGDSAGTASLLSAYATPQATALHFPLARWQRFRLRLAGSSKRQAIAAAVLALLAVIGELEPANPLSRWGLQRRMQLQRQWRAATQQPGPPASPLPVLLIDERSTLEDLAVSPTPGRTPRAALTAILERTPVKQVPVVGLDLVLDEPAPGTGELAALIRRQGRQAVIAGYYGPTTSAPAAGRASLPVPALRQAGVLPRNLSVGIAADAAGRHPVPLQLRQSLGNESFAGAMASSSDPLLPGEAVLDWSLDWGRRLRPITAAELATLQADALLVGSLVHDREGWQDLFPAPAAVVGQIQAGGTPLWDGRSDQLPGAILQAVLIQSLNLRHWLTPLSLTACTVAAAGAGVLLAAAVERPSRRALIVFALAGLSVPVALQLATGTLLLLPLTLPVASLGVTAILRRD